MNPSYYSILNDLGRLLKLSSVFTGLVRLDKFKAKAEDKPRHIIIWRGLAEAFNEEIGQTLEVRRRLKVLNKPDERTRHYPVILASL